MVTALLKVGLPTIRRKEKGESHIEVLKTDAGYSTIKLTDQPVASTHHLMSCTWS
jgi:hypothetical protein